jgi:hypothetical protein
MASAAFLAAFVLLAIGANASTVERLSLDQLIELADVIVRGRVTDITAQSAPRGRARTFTSLAVEKQFKGAPQDTIIIEQPGGATDDIALAVPGLPKFSTGENVIVFLKRRRDGAFTVVGDRQGKFNAKTGSGGNEIVEDFAHRTEPLGSFIDRLASKLQARG